MAQHCNTSLDVEETECLSSLLFSRLVSSLGFSAQSDRWRWRFRSVKWEKKKDQFDRINEPFRLMNKYHRKSPRQSSRSGKPCGDDGRIVSISNLFRQICVVDEMMDISKMRNRSKKKKKIFASRLRCKRQNKWSVLFVAEGKRLDLQVELHFSHFCSSSSRWYCTPEIFLKPLILSN